MQLEYNLNSVNHVIESTSDVLVLPYYYGGLCVLFNSFYYKMNRIPALRCIR